MGVGEPGAGGAAVLTCHTMRRYLDWPMATKRWWPQVNMDDPDVLELWNLVFMQFDSTPDGECVQPPPLLRANRGPARMGWEGLATDYERTVVSTWPCGPGVVTTLKW